MFYGPAGSGKSATLFEVVQFAKALGVAVLYIPNGEDGAEGAANGRFEPSLVSEPDRTGKDFDRGHMNEEEVADALKKILENFQAEYPDAGLNITDGLSVYKSFQRLITAFRNLTKEG
jgi:hypothetical protein